MQLRRTLAVADETFFYTGRGVAIQHAPFARMEDLLTAAEHDGYTHVWMMPDSRLAEPRELDGWYKLEMLVQRKTRIGYGSYVKRGKTRHDQIQVGFTKPWPWKIETPKQLLQTVTYLENELGFPLEWTPAHGALDCVRAKNATRWDWLAPLKIDLEKATPIPGFSYGEIGQALTDKRYTQKPGRYHIKLDGNSNFGAAETGLRCGEGDPRWVENAALYDGLRPGFWHVKCEKVYSIFNGTNAPSFEGYEWLTTDLLQQLRSSGYKITIKAGWVWEKYHQTLRSTISNKEKTGLWDLRLAWRARRQESLAAENVYKTISAMLQMVHGKLDDPHLIGKRLYRPDIWAMVVNAALARILYRIMKIYFQFNVLPVRIHIDGLEYEGDDPHMFDGMVSADKLGGLKLVSCVEIHAVSKVD